MAIIVAQVVALNPKQLESSHESNRPVEPELLIPEEQEPTLAQGVPVGRIPDYSVDEFTYVSVQSGIKQWRMKANRAFMYNAERLVHTRGVRAVLFDSDGVETYVTSREAKYHLNQRDLDLYGDVVATFPDGFVLETPYLRYQPGGRLIDIPTKYPVHGVSKPDKGGEKMQFWCKGLRHDFQVGRANLLDQVRLEFVQPPSKKAKKATPQKTLIESDLAELFRDRKVAYFSMQDSKPVDTRFVQITQPTVYVRSRKAELKYGSGSPRLEYLVASQDVYLKETDPEQKTPRYATGGRASFDHLHNQIVMTEYPQVYQGKDTMTGDTIIFNRTEDTVEVENGNAYTEGRE